MVTNATKAPAAKPTGEKSKADKGAKKAPAGDKNKEG